MQLTRNSLLNILGAYCPHSDAETPEALFEKTKCSLTVQALHKVALRLARRFMMSEEPSSLEDMSPERGAKY